ncbi:MFS transporter [Shimia marina]|uniref:H+ Antiporter protein n=1 Tax=Shimia marina TaxID=321267 RepID=A0A0P1FHG6_9RHOB|nr:MFS transporter [Shimia marina]CUH53882.1 H+ Antiporter protein [Shimia marina]SFE20404.1 Predicted arabinose efflux permease, MFS family [Shimia marina]
MWTLLKHPIFSRLFAAQLVALAGSGLLTIALGLLAFDLAGANAGAVLGIAYTIKMVAYVGLSPVMGALVVKLPRRAVLIGADVIRIGVALCLPFVDSVGQVYALIFLLQVASGVFTPTFQATIPDILPDEDAYTQALSLSRLASDLENILSPAFAGLLLLVMSFSGLFVGTALGFALSALLILRTRLPSRAPTTERPFVARLTRGSWIYLSTPRLRGLLAFNMAAAATTAYVLVNTVVVVRDSYGMAESGLAVAMGAFGVGSMIAAFTLPRLLHHISDRSLMGLSAALLALVQLAHGLVIWTQGPLTWAGFLAIWACAGLLFSAVMTPSGRLLKRSAHSEDRAAVFTAHFALSHACWLLAYPLAGWTATAGSQALSLIVLSVIGLGSAALGFALWQRSPADLPHTHPDLPADHPHLKAHGAHNHAHDFIIDDNHLVWPNRA